jgi:hypothetical protein
MRECVQFGVSKERGARAEDGGRRWRVAAEPVRISAAAVGGVTWVVALNAGNGAQVLVDGA